MKRDKRLAVLTFLLQDMVWQFLIVVVLGCLGVVPEPSVLEEVEKEEWGSEHLSFLVGGASALDEISLLDPFFQSLASLAAVALAAASSQS